MAPMEYTPELNLILEALCYLGLRANEAGRQTLEERFCSRGNTDVARFRALYAPFEQMRRELDRLTGLSSTASAPQASGPSRSVMSSEMRMLRAVSSGVQRVVRRSAAH